MKENIDKAAARWKQKASRSPLRGVFDRKASTQAMSSTQTMSPTPGSGSIKTSRKRSRSEDPSQSYVQRQRSVGLGMSFGMAASDLRSSPTREGGVPVSPPPLKARSSKRIKLAAKVTTSVGQAGQASVGEVGAENPLAYTQESMVVLDDSRLGA